MEPQWVENYNKTENIFIDIMVENIEYMTATDAEVFLKEAPFEDLEKDISINEIFCKYNELINILNDNDIQYISTSTTKEEIVNMIYELIKDKLIDKALKIAKENRLLIRNDNESYFK